MTTVVKLGGSLSSDPRLKPLLRILVDARDIIVVPGGGPYADAVRAQQTQWQFPDEQAHRMAVLAMDQFALQLHGMEPRLNLAINIVAIQQAKLAQRSAIWMPSTMVLSAPEIAMSWDMTSDSLAAWLSRAIGAERLILVKSCDIPPSATIAELIDRDIVDRGFAKMSVGAAPNIRIVSVGDFARLAQDWSND
jgi:5-(aminomethyl)-3-furanmethanol phosphate kinase